MLFNSTAFVLFFGVVYAGYLLLQGRLRSQNLWLLAASYWFYASWDWRFAGLLGATTLSAFLAGVGLSRSRTAGFRNIILAGAIGLNLVLLGFFKYFNFFSENAVRLLHAAGLQADGLTLSVVLPVGISFYVFQAIGYCVDVHRRSAPASGRLDSFALFISFFPQLVAGPIERSGALLPQIDSPRRITPRHLQQGIFLLLLGYLKKVVIADSCAGYVNAVFAAGGVEGGHTVLLGVFAFTLQIYGDFSGYSDIARGAARLLGIDLMQNFDLPYLSRNPREFWRRWHISLSSWFRDYLYIPLGGSRRGGGRTLFNLSVTMALCGLWHGAAWNFVLWGAYHALLLIGYRLLTGLPAIRSGIGGRLARSLAWPAMIALTAYGWLIFRSGSLEQLIALTTSLGRWPTTADIGAAVTIGLLLLPLLAVESVQARSRSEFGLLGRSKVRIVLSYVAIAVWILVFGVRESVEFIYFQF